MNNKKATILIIVVVILFLLSGFIILFGNDNNNNNGDNDDNPSTIPTPNPSTEVGKTSYVIIDDTDMWRYRNNNWSIIDEYKNFDEKFSVYINNKYFGNYFLKFGNKWNIFNDDNSYINYDGSLFAYTGEINIDLKNYELIDNLNSSDIYEINTIIDGNITDESLSLKEKVLIDLDNDGTEDKIISVSNIDSENEEFYFNLLYVILNGEKHILVNESVKMKDLLVAPIYNINYIANINDELVSSIVVRAGYYSNASKTHNLLFQFKNEKYKKVID